MPSSIPSLDEIRRVFRLFGECTELGADPFVWRQHLADGCSRLIAEHFVTLVESIVTLEPNSPPKPDTIGYFNGGSLINERFDLIHRFMKTPEKINPMVPAMLTSPKPFSTHLSRELFPEPAWHRTHFYQDYLRPLGLNDQATTVDLAAPHSVSAICWLSYERQRCSIRAASLLNLLHSELTRLKWEGMLAPIGGFSLIDLAPRQREVLYGLFQGDNEKQLALRLGISRHTVHDYLKRLHDRFGAASRGELIAACLKYWPALKQIHERGERNLLEKSRLNP